jgi:hypothetical protein
MVPLHRLRHPKGWRSSWNDCADHSTTDLIRNGRPRSWTSQKENVPATFFIIGKNGQSYPELVGALFNEGHEIGNHTFSHPNLGELPRPLVDLELNATQRLIRIFDRAFHRIVSSTLFRRPLRQTSRRK